MNGSIPTIPREERSFALRRSAVSWRGPSRRGEPVEDRRPAGHGSLVCHCAALIAHAERRGTARIALSTIGGWRIRSRCYQDGEDGA
jgi:hypothetical protein